MRLVRRHNRRMELVARIDDLSSPEVRQLIAEHLQGMRANSPPGHCRALAVEDLRRPDLTFWSIWKAQVLCGCGALKELDPATGELKSIRTSAAFARQGIGQFVIDEIVRAAHLRGYKSLYLETGSGSSFEPAHALFLKNGFTRCGAFGGHEQTHFNVFMHRILKCAEIAVTGMRCEGDRQ